MANTLAGMEVGCYSRPPIFCHYSEKYMVNICGYLFLNANSHLFQVKYLSPAKNQTHEKIQSRGIIRQRIRNLIQ